MAILTITNGEASDLAVVKVTPIVEDCMTIYEYIVTTNLSNTINITLTGNHYEAKYFDAYDNEITFTDNASVSYNGYLKVRFLLLNSGIEGTYSNATINITNVTTSNYYENIVERENDSVNCYDNTQYVQSVTGDVVDNTDPYNPIINIPTPVDYSNKLDSVVGGSNITIDNTDPTNPIINSSASASITLDTIITDGSTNPVENNAIYDALQLKANDSEVVHNTGDETIDGSKTFTDDLTTIEGTLEVQDKIIVNTTTGGTSGARILFEDLAVTNVNNVAVSYSYLFSEDGGNFTWLGKNQKGISFSPNLVTEKRVYVLPDKPGTVALLSDVEAAGGGDMLKATYDTNASGTVDDSEKLNSQLPSYYLNRSNHTGSIPAANVSVTDTSGFFINNNVENILNEFYSAVPKLSIANAFSSTQYFLNNISSQNIYVGVGQGTLGRRWLMTNDPNSGLAFGIQGVAGTTTSGAYSYDYILNASGEPTNIHDLTTKEYVDNAIASSTGVSSGTYLPLNGSDDMEGNLDMGSNDINNVGDINLNGTLSFNTSASDKEVTATTSDLYYNGNKIWHAANDGNGSGLDADKLKGYTPTSASTANTLALRDGSGNLFVSDSTYSSSWNGSTQVPTKNAIYDKIESLSTGTGLTQEVTSFTPSLIDVGGGATYSSTSKGCTLIKTGRTVTMALNFTNITMTGTPTGYLRMTGIPSGYIPSLKMLLNVEIIGGSTNFYSIQASTLGGQNYLEFKVQTSLDNSNTTSLSSTSFTSGGYIYISGTYITA